MHEPELDLLGMLRVLAQHQVEFIVIGGVAAVLHGAPVATFDLDIVHSRSDENLKRLETALRSLEAYYREHPDRRPPPDLKLLAGSGHHLLMTRGGPLDVLGEVSGSVGYEGLLPEAEEITLEAGLRIRVLSLPALIRLKELLGREKDRAALATLRRTLDEQI